MKIKKAFVVLLHLSLLVGAIFFVKNTIEEFLEGNTLYITTQEPLTPNDLPTVTICWQVDKTRTLSNVLKPLLYGKDFIINLKIIQLDEETITLLEDKPVQTSQSQLFSLNELHQRKTDQKDMPCHSYNYITMSSWYRRQCFKITPK